MTPDLDDGVLIFAALILASAGCFVILGLTRSHRIQRWRSWPLVTGTAHDYSEALDDHRFGKPPVNSSRPYTYVYAGETHYSWSGPSHQFRYPLPGDSVPVRVNPAQPSESVDDASIRAFRTPDALMLTAAITIGFFGAGGMLIELIRN